VSSPRKDNVDALGALHPGREQSTCRRADLDNLAIIAHRQVQNAPEPEQIFRPKLARNQVEI
jgi:hypothetical protein